MPVYIFLDTNALLHFRRPDEIDWRALTDGKEVEIVLTLSVLRELDRQKVMHPIKRLRKRAADLVKWIGAKAGVEEPIRLREGVRLSFRRQDPLIDYPAHRLRAGILDDELVASAIEFRDEHEEARVVIVTDDTAMRFLTPAHGIDAEGPPEEYRLPDEPDASEVEVRKLRAREWRS